MLVRALLQTSLVLWLAQQTLQGGKKPTEHEIKDATSSVSFYINAHRFVRILDSSALMQKSQIYVFATKAGVLCPTFNREIPYKHKIRLFLFYLQLTN